MKKVSLSIAATLFSIVMLRVFIPVVYHNYEMNKASKEFYSSIEKIKLPEKTTELKKTHKIYPPFSSNYCAPFIGVLFETTADFAPFENLTYLYSIHTAWVKDSKVIIKNSQRSPETFDLSCRTCFSQGISELLKDTAQNKTYVIFYTEKIDLKFGTADLRCH